MTKKERSAVFMVYRRLNKISSQIPSNPCDLDRLAKLSRDLEKWVPRCMNALFEIMDGQTQDAVETMESS